MTEANIYVSFNAKDDTLEDELEAQLTAALKDLADVKLLTSVTAPGHDIQQSQQDSISQADIILLLLSPDYLNSERSLRELELALKRREHAHVVPVLLRAVTIPAELRPLQIVPRDLKSVRSAEDRDRDDVLLKIVEDLLPIIRQVLRTKRRQTEEQALARARAEADAKARAEAEAKAKAEVEGAKTEVAQVKAELEKAKAEVEKAKAEAKRAKVEAETRKGAEAENANVQVGPVAPVRPSWPAWLVGGLLILLLAAWALRRYIVVDGPRIVVPIPTDAPSVPTVEPPPTTRPTPLKPSCPTGMIHAGTALCINETEVTAGEFKACENAGACPALGALTLLPNCNGNMSNRSDHPMNCVNQRDAGGYCAWKYPDAKGRLPTRSEWTTAASGGRKVFAPSRDQICWQRKSTCPVKSFPDGKTPGGLYDVVGNVSELTIDTYSKDGTVLAYNCGRSWAEDGSHELVATCTGAYAAVARIPEIGFRCVADVP